MTVSRLLIHIPMNHSHCLRLFVLVFVLVGVLIAYLAAKDVITIGCVS